MLIINLQTDGTELHLNSHREKKPGVNKVAEFFDPENIEGRCVENRHRFTKLPILNRIVLKKAWKCQRLFNLLQIVAINQEFLMLILNIIEEIWKKHY